MNMRNEVGVAWTVAAAEQSEAAPEGGSAGLPRKFWPISIVDVIETNF